MQVVLVKRVQKLGNENDVVTVKPGYARNFLFPQSLAVPASKDALKRAEGLKTLMVQKLEDKLGNAKEIAEKLKDTVLTFKKKARGDKLYGSIKDTDMVDALAEQAKVAINKEMVALEEPLRTLGEHQVKISLSEDLTVEVKVVIDKED